MGPTSGRGKRSSSPLKLSSGRKRSGSGSSKYDPSVVNSNYHNYINYIQKQKEKQQSIGNQGEQVQHMNSQISGKDPSLDRNLNRANSKVSSGDIHGSTEGTQKAKIL